MAADSPPQPPSLREGGDASLALPSGYSVNVDADGEQLVVRAPGGKVCVRIALTPEGPQVEIEAGSIALRSAGESALSGSRLTLEGREGIVLRSGTDMSIDVDGAMRSTALEHHIEATTGNIHVEANDDVKVDGERIRLNSPEPATLRRLDREQIERGKGVVVAACGVEEES